MSDKRHKKTPYGLTPEASKGNDFTRHLSGRPSIFCTAMLIAAANKSAAQTVVVEKNRAEGNDIGLIGGLSIRSATISAQYKARQKETA